MHARVLVLALLLLPGCFVVDGHYVVRGKVLGGAPSTAPIPGTTVSAGGSKDGGMNHTRAAADGSYILHYFFGGMFPLVVGKNPTLRFAAPGYRTRKVVLRSDEPVPGVARRPCDARERFCWELDVMLEPAEPAESRPAR